MAELLYLDTARRGQISDTAKRVLNKIVRFNADYGSCLYFDDLLYGGFDDWRPSLKRRFPNLQWWHGLDHLKSDFLELASGDRGSGNAVLASRTAELMKLSARMLFARCRNVLIVDSTWPSYEEILISQIPNDSCKVTKVAIRKDVLEQQMSAEKVAARIVRHYISEKCDGLFLPFVCNFGIKLPIEKIVAEIEKSERVRFLVVDAAQSINQVNQESLKSIADFVIFGTHKWLQAFVPMGVGVFSKPSSRSFIEDSVQRYLKDGEISDPLLAISHQDCRLKQFNETVNLTPLFAGAGAVWDSKSKNGQLQNDQIAANRKYVSEVLDQSNWNILRPDNIFQSRIQLFQSEWKMRTLKPYCLAKHFLEFGVAVTSYADGVCRISIPSRELTQGQKLAFENVASTS